MAMMKYGAAKVVKPSVDPSSWIKDKVAPGRVKIAKQVIGQHSAADWLLTHVTVMASVDCDYADASDPKSNYLIKPEHEVFVNNNGDSWERSLLAASYKTFLSADNFVEHVQIPELSKGKILDVALREVAFAKDIEGNDITTLYVDILIATNRKHVDLIKKIESGEYQAVSMGCLIKYSQCSQCGNIAADDTEACKHIKYYKGNSFFDKNGVKRVVAELCGRVEDPESCVFIEASWVRKPAFEGAVLRNIVDVNDGSESIVKDRLQGAFSKPSIISDIQFNRPDMLPKAASINSDSSRRVSASSAASSLLKSIYADDKEKPAEEEPTDTPELDLGSEDSGATEDSGDGMDDSGFPESTDESVSPVEGEPSLSDGAAGGSEEPQVPVDEPAEDATPSEVRDMFKRQILNDLRRELLQEQVKTDMKNRPYSLENDINESLVKDASSSRILLGSDAPEKLKNGIAIMSNLKEWSKLAGYGYSSDDVLGILLFIDRKTSNDPVPLPIAKSLTKVRLEGEDLTSFFTEVIYESGEVPNKYNALKVASWARILRSI